jgi:hypothetical protein
MKTANPFDRKAVWLGADGPIDTGENSDYQHNGIVESPGQHNRLSLEADPICLAQTHHWQQVADCDRDKAQNQQEEQGKAQLEVEILMITAEILVSDNAAVNPKGMT